MNADFENFAMKTLADCAAACDIPFELVLEYFNSSKSDPIIARLEYETALAERLSRKSPKNATLLNSH